ncbi:MAG: hypothetical protein AAGA53_15895 [Pseudomonadota bacterium]
MAKTTKPLVVKTATFMESAVKSAIVTAVKPTASETATAKSTVSFKAAETRFLNQVGSIIFQLNQRNCVYRLETGILLGM